VLERLAGDAHYEYPWWARTSVEAVDRLASHDFQHLEFPSSDRDAGTSAPWDEAKLVEDQTADSRVLTRGASTSRSSRSCTGNEPGTMIDPSSSWTTESMSRSVSS